MADKSIGLITYNCAHLKTEQVALGLHQKKKYDLHLISLPFTPRPQRNVLFNHRPNQFKETLPLTELAEITGASRHECLDETKIPLGFDYYIVLIGVLLSGPLLSSQKVLNCHAGIIPLVRGLDAFKWTILENQPLGNTLHFIDEEVDAGEVIAVLPTTVKKSDTIEELATRHYFNEIDALCNFEKHMGAPSPSYAGAKPREAHRRMPIEVERKMLNSFETYKARHATS